MHKTTRDKTRLWAISIGPIGLWSATHMICPCQAAVSGTTSFSAAGQSVGSSLIRVACLSRSQIARVVGPLDKQVGAQQHCPARAPATATTLMVQLRID